MYQFPHFLTLPISLPLLHHPPPLLALDLFPPPLLSFLVCRAWLGVSTTSRQLATAAGQTVTPSPSRPPFNPPCLLQDTEFPHSLHSLDTGPPKAFNTLYASGLQPEFLHCWRCIHKPTSWKAYNALLLLKLYIWLKFCTATIHSFIFRDRWRKKAFPCRVSDNSASIWFQRRFFLIKMNFRLISTRPCTRPL